MRVVLSIVVLLCLLGPAVVAESAETRPLRYHGIGPRAGLSLDPDQFVFGGHVDFGDFFPNTMLLFPVVEVGVGSGGSVISIGADALYRFRDRWGAWTPYLGGELGLIIVSPDEGSSQTDAGLSVVLGIDKEIRNNQRFGFEIKVGVVDTPDVKFTGTWTFGS